MSMLRNRVYYRVKPFIPQSVRTAIRRRITSRLRDKVTNIWPIMPGSECAPENWRGWPQGKKFAFVLTHDVEGITGLHKCRRLMELELSLGFRSSFNFVPEGDYRVSPELRQELTRNGFEVGIHDLKHDGRLFVSHREFSRRAARINQYACDWNAVGFRSGFMLHELEWLHGLDIQYDASTFDTDPFEPQPEGRHTIFPFWVPRPNEASINSQLSTLNQPKSGYVELPYTLPQDSTLFLLLQEAAPDIWLRKLDWVAENGGMALVITHPDYMAFSERQTKKGEEYPAELYKRLLEHVRSRYSGQYWQALPRDVARHVFQNQNSLKIQSRIGTESARPELSTLVEGSTNGEVNPRPPSNALFRLRAKRAAVLLFSYYPADPRPRRAAEALAREGVIVDLICLRQDQSELTRETINGVSVFRVPLKRHRGGKIRYICQYSSFILRCFFHLGVRSSIRRYDFVHVHNMPDVLVFSALIPKILGAKVILDLHDPMPELMQTIFHLPEESISVRFLKRLERWSIGFVDLVLTVNRACERIYSSRSCPSEKIKVVLNSPEDEIFRFQPAGLDNSNGKKAAKPFIVLYHGSLVRRNGFDLAVDALEKAKKSIPEAKLVVCGERTSFFDEVMESVQERGLQEDVEYLGVRSRRQVVEAINGCDIGVIPNQRNIFTEINTPTRIFEYLALGKPVVAPRTQGIRDYFGDDELVFFQVGDAEDLASQIEFAFCNPDKVAEIAERGQRVYLEHTWSQEKSGLLNSIAGLF